MSFSAVILAGGQSRRMGRDKAWVNLDGKPLLERQVELVQSVGASQIFISGRANVDYHQFELPVLTDRAADSGPLGGIERALEAASQSLLLVLATDMAHMTADVLRSLSSLCQPGCGAIPRVNGFAEPLAAIYTKSSWADAAHVLTCGSRSVTAFAELCVAGGRASFEEIARRDTPCFKSWNTPEDIASVTREI